MGIALLLGFSRYSNSRNTVAIVITAGPIAKEISEQYDIEPKRSASLLDIFTSGMRGLFRMEHSCYQRQPDRINIF